MVGTAFAKINLGLDIVGSRSDGYHEIRTVMQLVTLCDTVTIERNGTGTVAVSPLGEENLCYKAANVFLRSVLAKENGIHIDIDKAIPMQAGLGGGSSDAAVSLIMLNRLFKDHFSLENLQRLAESIGADVPFFIGRKTALAEGIGNVLTPIKPLPRCHIVIAKCAAGVSTKDAYALYDKHPQISRRPDFKRLLEGFENGDLPLICDNMVNVFEEVIDIPDIKIIKETAMRHGALGASLSGSGSAVFALFADKERAEECAALLRETYAEVFLTTPV